MAESTYNFVTESKTPQDEWLKGMGITADMYNNYDIGTKRGLLDSYNKTFNAPTTGLSGNSYNEYMNQKAFGGLGVDLTKGGLQDIGMGANILGAGYDLYSNLLGDKHDMFKTQMSALKQNMANIAQDRANHQTYVNNIGGGFNSAFGKGLAASAATKL